MSDRHYCLVNQADITRDEFVLNSTETRHIKNVLRLGSGSEVWLIDGNGMGYSGEIVQFDGDITIGKITARYPELGESPVKIQLALGIIKRDYFELAIEKAVELGVNSLSPLVLDRCIKRTVRIDRLEKLISAAVKQCGRSRLPIVKAPIDLSGWLNSSSGMDQAVCHFSGLETLTEWFAKIEKPERGIAVLIGPEGDFSQRELDLLKQHNVRFVNLGQRRLRSETAVMAALAVLNESSIVKGMENE